MSRSWKIGLISTVSMVLMASPRGPFYASDGEQTAATGQPVETRGSDWTVQVNPAGTLEIAHKRVAIITTENLYWGPKWAWGNPEFKFVPEAEGRYRLAGTAHTLKVKLAGDLVFTAPNVIRMDLLIRSEEAMKDAIGGGWQWNIRLDSPTFEGRSLAPELLPTKKGWTCRVGQDQAITLRFDEGNPNVYFERDQKNAVRTFFVHGPIEVGTRRLRVTLELPEGARRRPTPQERYEARRDNWFPGALAPDAAPVDLSFLNRDDRPAGRRGFVHADGDRLVYADGSPARFWGGNLVAYALFSTRREEVPRQAHRMARLGYNLMRIHHHDSAWVDPNIFGSKPKGTRSLDPRSLDSLDWWIKCLEDEGIYVWLDMHVGRVIKPADGLTEGADDVAKGKGLIAGFSYYNPQIQEMMIEFQNNYLNHFNKYTNKAYKNDPGVMGVLITNENDLTNHFGNMMLPDYKYATHSARWTKDYKEFARRTGLPADRVYQTWLPGPSKLQLAEAEHRFNRILIDDLRKIGVEAPIATTNFWGANPMFSLPSLTDGDLIDVHTYGQSEEFERNPHYQGNFLDWIACGQVHGMPLSITEWNVEYPSIDRFTGPLSLASIASLQGWDAPMIFTYSMSPFSLNPQHDKWSTYADTSLTAIMPTAALLYRQGHVGAAKKKYCLMLDSAKFFGRALTPATSVAVRTLAEQSKLTIGMPEVRELPWLKPTKLEDDVIVLTDPDRDFIPTGQSFVQSDTGEVTRNWEEGIQTIDTPRTQAVAGWIGGKTIKTHDASFETSTKKAVVALTSVDGRPLAESRFVLVTAVARAVPSPGNRLPFLSEPVYSKITLRTTTPDLELLALGKDGRVIARPRFDRRGDEITFEVPSGGGTHWYLLKTRGGATGERSVGAGGGAAPGSGR